MKADRMRATAGLTLVELLVAMGILGILTLLVSQFFTQGSSLSMASSSRSELQQEVLNAQQLMVSNLRAAWYVYPVGADITMTSTALTQKPDGGNTWKVGTDPIVAMVLLPQDSSQPCTTTVTLGCFRFRAYYPVKRSVWVTGTSGESWRNPGPDQLNDSKVWVLAEYRGNIDLNADDRARVLAGTLQPAVPTTNPANLLADYIAPTTSATAPYTMFTYGTDNRSLTMRLAVMQQVGSQTLRLPNATGTYEITTTFNNVGKLPKF